MKKFKIIEYHWVDYDDKPRKNYEVYENKGIPFLGPWRRHNNYFGTLEYAEKYIEEYKEISKIKKETDKKTRVVKYL